ncbi:hypothetical protein KY290_022984 [Solanum tuberosum]|uniref:Uncharacterized protein n=1 Tax=Solanum tuberosum TaxID=4113 RepID=A0ABQ7V614_SOLTU|nr:hypothetical protein KY289_032477 [Solanum tuberosum]KAH0759491.1 hypothetical protein KY290_022984 [Solanum tuberosum]
MPKYELLSLKFLQSLVFPCSVKQLRFLRHLLDPSFDKLSMIKFEISKEN